MLKSVKWLRVTELVERCDHANEPTARSEVYAVATRGWLSISKTLLPITKT